MITSLSTPVNDQDVLEGTGLDDKDAVSWIEDSNPLRSRFYLGVPKRASEYNLHKQKKVRISMLGKMEVDRPGPFWDN